MSIFQQMAAIPGTDDELLDALYSLVATEIGQGKIVKPLWTKALAQCDFDSAKTQAFYVRERVARLRKNIKEIRQYASAANRLQEALKRHELDSQNLHRMKEDMQALEQMNEAKKEQLSIETQKVRQRLHDEFSQSIDKNTLYTWIGTTVIVVLLIPAYLLGILGRLELYLTLPVIIMLAILVQATWRAPLEIRVASELAVLKKHLNIDENAKSINKLSNDILRLEPSVENTEEIANHQNRLIELESKLAPLFQYESLSI